MKPFYLSAALVALLGLSASAQAATFPFKGSDGSTYTGQTDQSIPGAETDVGGTITTGGTAQTVAALNAARRGFEIQNLSSGDLYFNCNGVTATLDYHSIKVPSGALYDSPPNHVTQGACSIIGATTGQAYHFSTY